MKRVGEITPLYPYGVPAIETFTEGEKTGQPKRWKARCKECGQEIVQNAIDPRYIELLEKERPNAAALMRKEFPEMRIPRECAGCARTLIALATKNEKVFYTTPPNYFSRNPGAMQGWEFGEAARG
jgi:hypothetical protein